MFLIHCFFFGVQSNKTLDKKKPTKFESIKQPPNLILTLTLSLNSLLYQTPTLIPHFYLHSKTNP